MAYNTTDDCTARPIKVVLLDEWMGHGDAAGWKHDDAAGVEWEHGGFAGGQVDEWGRMEARWSCWMGTRKYFCYVLMIRAEVNYNL